MLTDGQVHFILFMTEKLEHESISEISVPFGISVCSMGGKYLGFVILIYDNELFFFFAKNFMKINSCKGNNINWLHSDTWGKKFKIT